MIMMPADIRSDAIYPIRRCVFLYYTNRKREHYGENVFCMCVGVCVRVLWK